MKIEVYGKTAEAKKVLKSHYDETKKIKNRLGLAAYGVKHELKESGKVLIINFNGLIKLILKKGGEKNSLTTQMKNNFLDEICNAMREAGVKNNEYEVLFLE